MELCTARPISNLPHCSLFTSSHTRFLQFHSNFPASRISVANFRPTGLRYYTNSSIRSSYSDETSRGASPYAKDGSDGVITLEETEVVEKKEYGENFPSEAPQDSKDGSDGVITLEETVAVEKKDYVENFPSEAPQDTKDGSDRVITLEETVTVEKKEYVENFPSEAPQDTKDGSDRVITLEETVTVEKKEYVENFPSEAPQHAKDGSESVITMEETVLVEENEYGEKFPSEAPKEESPKENQLLQFEFLEKLDIKFDSDESYSILLFGGGALLGLYLVSAIVRAIDSIPLVPTLMQIVGLSYTVWFSIRYLLFKESREALAAKIGDIKQQVLGSDDDDD